MLREQRSPKELNTMSKNLRVAGIVNDSITDGPGLRLTIFMQGCLNNCKGCHNPQSIPMDGGTFYSVDELLEKITANPLLSGVTFSGGEPLLQAEGLIPLAKKIIELGLDIIIYTGYTFEEILSGLDSKEDHPIFNEYVLRLLKLSHMLIDGPYVDAERSLVLQFRGSKNQRILDIPESLNKKKPVLSQVVSDD